MHAPFRIATTGGSFTAYVARPQKLPAPAIVVRTEGARGGYYVVPDGARFTFDPVPVVVRGDTYGAGDTFAAALTFALGEQRPPGGAVMFAATRAAEVLGFDGPYPPDNSPTN